MSVSVVWLKSVRKALRAIEKSIQNRTEAYLDQRPPGDSKGPEYSALFDRLVEERQTDEFYMREHRARLIRTMEIVPEPRTSMRVLELGAYMQMTPALQIIKGYKEVRGAYFGPAGSSDRKELNLGGRTVFECTIDLFNAESDRFPHPSGYFETVLCCEMLEHLLRDPMHMILEIYRVLEENGRVLITTPNCTSYTSVARALKGDQNPQMYAFYDHRPEGDVPHVREYAPAELKELLAAGGFIVEALFTEPIEIYKGSQWVHQFLEETGFSPSLRGEQMYAIARKDSSIVRERYPRFLYD